MLEAIGLRLRSLRIFHGVSQRELAKRSGVPNSAISVIEQGSVSPSVSSLERVLNGFPISLASFFSIPIAKQSHHIRRGHTNDNEPLFAKLIDSGDVAYPDCEVHFYSSTNASSSKNHLNRYNSLLLIISGAVTFFSIDTEQVLNQGDSVSISPFVPYRLESIDPQATWSITTV
jgi:transcriptional regulator with XRE-family HTH domain